MIKLNVPDRIPLSSDCTSIGMSYFTSIYPIWQGEYIFKLKIYWDMSAAVKKSKTLPSIVSLNFKSDPTLYRLLAADSLPDFE